MACKEPQVSSGLEWDQLIERTMFWATLVFLFYLLMGAVLVAWLFGGMNAEAEKYEVLLLILLWPFALPFFRFLLYSKQMLRRLKELEENLD